MLHAEPAELAHFELARSVLLVFRRVVVSLLALGAGQRNFIAHDYLCKGAGTAGKAPRFRAG
jgi:hypothetical protein